MPFIDIVRLNSEADRAIGSSFAQRAVLCHHIWLIVTSILCICIYAQRCAVSERSRYNAFCYIRRNGNITSTVKNTETRSGSVRLQAPDLCEKQRSVGEYDVMVITAMLREPRALSATRGKRCDCGHIRSDVRSDIGRRRENIFSKTIFKPFFLVEEFLNVFLQ